MLNAPSGVASTSVQPYKHGTFDEYLSFCAVGGLITTDDGQVSRMTEQEFCRQYSINRKTAYRWRQAPGFADRVRTRRDELFPLARETACWNRLYLIGLQSKDLKAAVQALTLILGHFGGLRLPSQDNTKSRRLPGSLAELLSAAEKQMQNATSASHQTGLPRQ